MVYAPAPDDPLLPPVRINLLSDTQTTPSRAMRAAMAEAAVGDEQIGADPTVNRLCERVADLLGKEAAVFMATGTICNIAATLAHCRAGDEILAHESSHIVSLEGCTHAALGGFQIKPLAGARGQFSADTLRAALRPPDRHQAKQTLVSVEQTTNLGGGTVWSKPVLDEVVAVAHAAGLATHMDGARLLNACVASATSPRQLAEGWDSVWIDFSKGLGAPLGAVLAGSRDFIDEVWRWKQRLGGSLRQAGICAAACIFALDHNVHRLAGDHANAALLASRLAAIDGVTVQFPETNLVYFDITGTGLADDAFVAALRSHGILISTLGGRLRACTHLDVTPAMIIETVDIVGEVVRTAQRSRPRAEPRSSVPAQPMVLARTTVV
ncbi:threonine aldolase [Rhodopseudomonas sp. AAP120]|uniref:threonine aldolase family protein n=1 Tax=Rhodopseudomonas sp. AAP120 TaxID=1523430 RepID=UPI0006B8C31D|nr:threonine aldolase family protein [Rhodopseudomonas sp. AAP120]KPG01950.1 threonine aldolase [Rhodopseudomonas sp. AAP120]